MLTNTLKISDLEAMGDEEKKNKKMAPHTQNPQEG
jgi:hypothetical protein